MKSSEEIVDEWLGQTAVDVEAWSRFEQTSEIGRPFEDKEIVRGEEFTKGDVLLSGGSGGGPLKRTGFPERTDQNGVPGKKLDAVCGI